VRIRSLQLSIAILLAASLIAQPRPAPSQPHSSLPQMKTWVAQLETAFDTKSKSVQTTLALSTRESDLLSLDLSKWLANHKRSFSDFSVVVDELRDAYSGAYLNFTYSLTKADRCAFLELTIAGAEGYGVAGALTTMGRVRAQTLALVATLQAVQKDLQNRRNQVVAVATKQTLTDKINSLQETIRELNGNVSWLDNEQSYAPGSSRLSLETVDAATLEALRADKCPGYGPAAAPTPTPTATPKPATTKPTPTPKATPTSNLTPAPKWTACPLSVPAYRCCPPGTTFDVGLGKCVKQTVLRRPPRTSTIIARDVETRTATRGQVPHTRHWMQTNPDVIVRGPSFS